jgi:Holliday junction DNA helicase RuvB
MIDIFDLLGITQILEMGKEVLGIKPKEYHSDQIEPFKFDFTPSNLLEYIGQDNAKLRINTYIKKVNTIKPIHLLISGTRGHGKSTLAYIIANMLGFSIDTYVGGSFTKDNLIKWLVKNQDTNIPKILFIDEIHGLEREITEYMLPILQSFILPEGNLKLKKFIMLGATTNLEILQKKAEPFVDRCDIIELERYNSTDIKNILKQYNDKLYKKNIPEEIYDEISINTRYNPRTSLSIFEDFLVEENIEQILRGRQIIKNSLTTKDLIVLKHLVEIKTAVGVETLAILTQQTKQTYMELQEPFLLQQGYISRTARGRIATDKARLFIQELK